MFVFYCTNLYDLIININICTNRWITIEYIYELHYSLNIFRLNFVNTWCSCIIVSLWNQREVAVTKTLIRSRSTRIHGCRSTSECNDCRIGRCARALTADSEMCRIDIADVLSAMLQCCIYSVSRKTVPRCLLWRFLCDLTLLLFLCRGNTNK